MKTVTIVDDVYCKWSEAEKYVKFMVVPLDPEESDVCVGCETPSERPNWVDWPEDGLFEESDYAEWYAKALDAAYKQGYVVAKESKP